MIMILKRIKKLVAMHSLLLRIAAPLRIILNLIIMHVFDNLKQDYPPAVTLLNVRT